MSLSHRIGNFFILIGVLLIGLFVLSDLARAPVISFLLASAALIIVGGLLRFLVNPPPPPPPPERFRIFKRKEKKGQGKK
jgi:hypothetical protein